MCIRDRPEKLDHFLEEIFAECPRRISVKTRVGVNDAGEWEHLLSIYEKYPMEEDVYKRQIFIMYMPIQNIRTTDRRIMPIRIPMHP